MSSSTNPITFDTFVKVGGVVASMLLQGFIIFNTLNSANEKLKDRIVEVEKTQIETKYEIEKLNDSLKDLNDLRSHLADLEQQSQDNFKMIIQLRKQR